MNTYKVVVTPGQKYWVVRVPQLKQVTQTRNLSEVEAVTRDLIATLLEVPEDSFDVDREVELPDDVAQTLAERKRLTAQARKANTQAAEESQKAARQLRDRGLTLTDIGTVLGVSRQRAHQLVNAM